MTIYYILRFETPLTWRGSSRIYIPQEKGGPVIPPGTFVASYDTQGYGGGARNRLHTGETSLYKLGTDRI
jgi:hypothetical protein